MTGDEAPRSPRRGLADLAVLVDRVRTAGPEVRVTGGAGELPEGVDAAAYAIVQESLTNVLRHASANAVVVDLARTAESLTITVTDDGRGGVVHDEGMARGMRERVSALGGTLSAEPVPAGGFRVLSVLPVTVS